MQSIIFAATLLACTIPLQPTRTSFVTTVRVGDSRPLRFLVDTGASMTVVDRDIAGELRLEPRRSITALSTTGPVETQEAMLRAIRVGQWNVDRVTTLIASLPAFRNHGHLDGIVGMNMFAGHSLLFDVEHRCVEVDGAVPRMRPLTAHTIADRVAFDVDGMNFVLDSGASFPLLMSPAAQSLAARVDETEMTSAAGTKRVSTGVIPLLRIAGHTFRNVGVAFAPLRDAREDAIIPVTMFRRVYIAAHRDFVVVDNP